MSPHRGEVTVTTEAETGVLWPPELEEARNRFFQRGHDPADTSETDFWTSGLQNYETIKFFATKFVVMYYSSLRMELIQNKQHKSLVGWTELHNVCEIDTL